MRLNQLLTAGFILLSSLLFSQKTQTKIPKEIRIDASKLAHYLTDGISDDSLKALTIYAWVTDNISYEYERLVSGKPLRFTSPNEVLKHKTTVCQGYSALTVAMFNAVGIDATTVDGYASSIQSDSLDYITDPDHEWIAFKVRSKWYLGDPTYDAGYIGRVPKYAPNLEKKEKLKVKRSKKLAKIKKEQKRKKKEYKWSAKDKKEVEKEEEKRNQFKSKIGFVKQADTSFFMISSDEFVQSHLPAVPAFQLKEHPITMADFVHKTKTWDTILNRQTSPTVDYAAIVDDYADFKLHDKWVDSASEGLAFNPYSYGTMAVNHHNYVGIHLSKSMREKFSEISNSDLHESLPAIKVINDSVMIYAKKAEKIAKVDFGTTKKIVTGESKLFKNSDKKASSFAKKAVSAQEKTVEDLKKQKDRIEKNIETLQEKKSKLLSVSQSYKDPSNYDFTLLPANLIPWKDSLFLRLQHLDTLRQTWEKNSHTDVLLDKRFSYLEFAYQKSYTNLIILNMSPIFYSDSIVLRDSLVGENLEKLTNFHKLEYANMLYPDEIMKEIKEIEKSIKSGQARLKTYAAKNVNWKITPFLNYSNGLLYQVYDITEKNWIQAESDRQQLIQMEKYFARFYAQIEENLKEEETFKEKNTAHNLELMENDKERTTKMYKEIIKDSEMIAKKLKKVE